MREVGDRAGEWKAAEVQGAGFVLGSLAWVGARVMFWQEVGGG